MTDIKIGFTGTQRGMTKEQKAEVDRVFGCYHTFDLHHGDCIGADSDAGDIALAHACEVILHPPINTYKRRYHPNFISVREPKEYIARNHDIVDETDFLLATPGEKEEQLRSGTWATIRYAKKTNKQVYIVYPDGEVWQSK